MKRLNKYISDSGLCSRREADVLIQQGRVWVNDEIPELGCKVTEQDRVLVDNKLISAAQSNRINRIYLAYNKPVGITCTTERQVKGNIVDAVAYHERIFPIGRLDKPSDGLILLTNDGDIVNKILRAENAHEKEYRVVVDRPITAMFIDKMQSGVPVLGQVTKPCKVVRAGKCSFDIILTQGLNRQIRRMCEYLGYSVQKLTRKRIMHIHVKGIAPGKYRHLSALEMEEMQQAVQSSTKHSTAS